MRAGTGVVAMDNWTAGDYGGAFAGLIAGLAALGKGLAWLLNWHGAREERRAKKLAAWEASLTQREKEQREKTERRLAEVEGELAHVTARQWALGNSLIECMADLRDHNPGSDALDRAKAVLRAAFPPDFTLPTAFADLVARFDAGGKTQ